MCQGCHKVVPFIRLVNQMHLCVVQPTDDIVLMAQALEKIFLQKVAQMPQEEVALLPPAPKGKNKSKQPAAATTGTAERLRKHTFWGVY